MAMRIVSETGISGCREKKYAGSRTITTPPLTTRAGTTDGKLKETVKSEYVYCLERKGERWDVGAPAHGVHCNLG